MEMPQEPEQMDGEILKDLPDLIDLLEELLSDFDFGHTVCWNTSGNMTYLATEDEWWYDI